MHPSVMAFGREMLTPDVVRGKHILEVGSYDVNGSLRGLCRGAASYRGIDMQPGSGVDQVMDAAEAPVLGTFDLVITTEMLEHAGHWKEALIGAAGCVKMSGHLLLTTRGPGFPVHGFPSDHWRFTIPILHESLTRLGFDVLDIRSDPEAPGVLAFAQRLKQRCRPELPDAIPLQDSFGASSLSAN